MEKQKTVLITLSVLVEVPEDVLDDEDFNDFNRLESSLSEALESVKHPYIVNWISTRSLTLDPAQMNCGQCESCGCWMSNRESPDYINELSAGAKYNERLLCDLCLPKGHKWSF